MKPAIFLDRDGVINELVLYSDTGEDESPRSPADVRIIPNAILALGHLQKLGLPLFVVSNQPSYAKGKTSLGNLKAVHTYIDRYLRSYGIILTEFYYCFCHPDGVVPEYTRVCDCRKPKPGLLLAAQAAHHIDLNQSWMIGDSDSDVLCGQSVGCQTILIDYARSVQKRSGAVQPGWRCTDLLQAARIILEQGNRG